MYEKELATFRKRLEQLNAGSKVDDGKPVEPLPQVRFKLKDGAGETFTVEKGAPLFADGKAGITDLAPELQGFKGIRISPKQGGTLRFDLDKDAQILVGFVASAAKSESVLDPETEQWNLVLLNAVSAPKVAAMSVWAKPLSAGKNELDMGKGQYVVLGFIPADLHVAPRVNLTQASGATANLDWLFE
jgi:hypothetical protein